MKFIIIISIILIIILFILILISGCLYRLPTCPPETIVEKDSFGRVRCYENEIVGVIDINLMNMGIKQRRELTEIACNAACAVVIE